MKQIIFFFALLVGLSGIAQDPPANLDSIVISNLTLKARDWAYLVANVNLNNRDSATYADLRTMRDQIQAANPQGWQANVTVTNIRGAWLVAAYQHIRLVTAGESEQLDPTARQNIHSKTELTYWYDNIDARFPASYIDDRNTGKYILLDKTGGATFANNLPTDDQPQRKPAAGQRREPPKSAPKTPKPSQRSKQKKQK